MPPVVPRSHPEKLAFHPLGRPPGDRVEFLLRGCLEFSHESLSISRKSPEVPLPQRYRSPQCPQPAMSATRNPAWPDRVTGPSGQFNSNFASAPPRLIAWTCGGG
jgi:hypothetical protein